MDRLIYWMRKCIFGNGIQCKYFCPMCKYYKTCKIDDME